MYNQSKISVIVPVFNSEKYLHRCVDSILSQTYTDFELLLINDGSTDCCGFICDEYAIKDRRVRVFHKENGGVSSARNLGIENATGEWIAFCDSDDFVESSWLLTYIENSSNVDLVIQGYHNDECGLENFDFEGTSNDVVKQLFIQHVLGYIHTKLFRKRTLLEYHIRFNETVRFREDEDFVLKYLCYNKSVRCVKSGGYNYIMPDLSIKYSYTDNFQVCLSMYSSVCTIYNGEVNIITDSYMTELINAYFYSFNNHEINHTKRTEELKATVGKKILGSARLSKISRYILYYMPSFIVSRIFFVKNQFYNRWICH